MALLVNELSVWEIAHRWAGFDPEKRRFRLPLPVCDNARILLNAILHSELESYTLQTRKWRVEDGEEQKQHFIRHHLDAVHACIAGRSFSRPLLKWAFVERYEMKAWCEGQAVPLPEFWFPETWNLAFDWTVSERAAGDAEGAAGGRDDSVRGSTRTRIACQEIAKAIWRDQPDMTIAAMVKQEAVQKLGGGCYFSEDSVRGWLSAVAPTDVKAKRGRPRKKYPSLP